MGTLQRVMRGAIVGVFVLWGLGLRASAQTITTRPIVADTTPFPQVQHVSAAPPGAPVVIGTDTLFRLYGALGPFSPQARATAATARLEQVASRVGSGADSIVVVDAGTHTELVVGDVVIMTVLDADAAAVGGPRLDVARTDARIGSAAMVEESNRRSTRAVVRGVAYATLATLALLALLRLLAVAFRRAHRRLAAARDAAAWTLRIQRFEIVSADQLIAVSATTLRFARVALTIIALYFFVPLVLSFFPWTALLSHRIVGYALTPVAAAATAIVNFVPNLFYLTVIALLARFLLKFIHAFFRAVESGAFEISGFRRDWGEPTYKIVQFLILAFTLVVAFPYLPGASSDAFKGVSVFLGVILSFGSSGAVGNVIAGIVLTYTGAFTVGDRVRVGETVGDVVERTLLVTRIRTIKNVEVTVPNGAVLASHVVNYSSLAATRGLILDTTVTIGYDAPWETVHRLLVDAARRTEHVLPDPAPFVLQMSLDDFYVTYQLNAYTDQPNLMAATYSQLHANIQNTFNESGVEIMSPHYAALRDGNATANPMPPKPANGHRPRGFRVGIVRMEDPEGTQPAGDLGREVR